MSIITDFICPDCGKEVDSLSSKRGICKRCETRRSNAHHSHKEYIPYIKLAPEQQQRIDHMQQTWSEKAKTKTEATNKTKTESTVKTNKTETKTEDIIKTLQEYGCTASTESLIAIMQTLEATKTLRDMIMIISNDENQETLLNLEQLLNAIERKKQHVWEFNGFQEEDEKDFKEFLRWRRDIKGTISFWKTLYQTGLLVRMKDKWDTYCDADTVRQEGSLLASDRATSTYKRYQITTVTISTILNTRKPFSRVFYAISKEDAYNKFIDWIKERSLHEDKAKTVITEL